MKKVCCIAISSLFTLATIAGCSLNDNNEFQEINEDTEIEFTAQLPVYEFNSETMQEIVYYTNHGKENGYDAFNEFYKYYINEYKDTVTYDFYLLKPGDDIVGWLPHCLYREFQILQRTDVSDYSIIHEYIMLLDDKLEKPSLSNNDLDGLTNYNIILSIYLAPVSSTVTGLDYRLEFGNNYDNSRYKQYINICLNDICIATCYYYTNQTITYSWFSQYFKDNLFME